jgi:Rieske Fe-S protein
MSDKYPPESGRRRFVKGVVGASALGSVAAGGSAVLGSATSQQGVGGGSIRYVGIENTAGPAPRGMPIVPLRITDDGYLEGRWPEPETIERKDGTEVTVARTEIGGVRYSSKWFQYCCVQSYAGAQPDADADTRLRKKGGYPWASDIESGQPLSVEQFADYREWGNGIGQSGLGKPLNADWRTTENGRPLPVEVLRSPEVSKMIDGEEGFHDYGRLSDRVREFLAAATERDFIAWLDKCTHFCCTPGFKTSTYEGASDAVYCQCHQSIYDPFSPVERQFVALPRID